jgi:hypothetical protein
VGTVVGIAVYPVRGCAGIPLERADVGATGLAGDRTHAVVDTSGRGAARAGRARAGRRHPHRAPRPRRRRRSPPRSGRRCGSSRAAAGPTAPRRCTWCPARRSTGRAAGVVPAGCGAEDPRANLLLDLPGATPDDDERTWVGRQLRLGSAVLEVTRLPRHCLGVYAEVVRPGTVAVGDAVVPA